MTPMPKGPWFDLPAAVEDIVVQAMIAGRMNKPQGSVTTVMEIHDGSDEI